MSLITNLIITIIIFNIIIKEEKVQFKAEQFIYDNSTS